MPPTEPNDKLPPRKPLPPELIASKHTWKVAHLFAGVALPIACFSLNFWVMGKPSYRSGNPWDFAVLFLRGEAAFVFYPLLALSMAAMGVAVFRFEAAARSFPVRLGVYLGVPLALQYSVAMFTFLLLAAVLVPVVVLLPLGARWLLLWLLRTRRIDSPWAPVAVAVMSVLAIGGTVWIRRPAEFWFGLLIVLLGCAPLWSLVSYSLMSLRLFRSARRVGLGSRHRRAWLGGWLAAYAASLVAAVERTIAEYAKLPTKDPADCYVATAAALGHPWFVKSVPVAMRTGGTMLVNDQLRTLKCAEVALEAVAPRLHRAVRGVYDLIGPVFARMLVHPVLADAAYLALKPFEWLARVATRCIVPDIDELARKVYG